MEMIIRDIIPTHIVEKPGFRNLILLLEPKYTMVSRQCLQYTLVPEKVQIVQQSIKDLLEDVKSCSVTLDIWSSRRMHGYLGITCHFVSSNWQIQSFLLCCKQIKGRHTGDSISLESESVTEEYGITTKVFKVITDNAYNMIKAFGPMIHELTIVNDDDDDEDKSEETNEYSSSSEDDDTDENNNSGDEDEDSTFVTNEFDSIPVHHGD